MLVDATGNAPLDTEADTIAIGVLEGETPELDLPGVQDATSELGKVVLTHGDGRRYLLVGLGTPGQLDHERTRVAAAHAQRRAAELGSRELCWLMPKAADNELTAALVQGTVLRSYRFERYKKSPSEPPRLLISSQRDIEASVAEAALVAGAQNSARDLANEPANELTPGGLARYAEELAGGVDGLHVTTMGEEQIRASGMGAFAAVAQGSAQEAKLISLEYRGDPAAPKLGLVGKAVTFDAGGLSLKPAAKMHEMKFDMAGGAAVIEAIGALARMQAAVNVLGLVGATENLPSGTAIKPGDIVTALDRTTIEVNNTDAEGRLVLADCLALAREQGCEQMVDVATLTGGVVVALGSVYAGLFSNDERLAKALGECGERTGELVWRLPLDERYAEMVKGRFAQLTNNTERREASPITGAEFLHHFAGDVPWAHLDIAGTAYDVPRAYYGDKGATGFGVRLLVELAAGLSRQPLAA